MPAELRVDPNSSGQLEVGWIDGLILALAERQHGVVARDQLSRAGVTRHVIDHKVALGRLCLLHRGVYAVGHRVLTRQGRWMGAVLAAGERGVLSHRSAAALWEIRPSDFLEVTSGAHRARRGIRVHTARLAPDEVTVLRGIPVTDVSRTLLDLAMVLPLHQLERAINQAEVRRLGGALSLGELVARYPGRRGLRAIKEVLARLDAGAGIIRSELEDRFLAFLRASRLPPPQVNALLLGFECDCVWPTHGLVVELDGHTAHGTRGAFERDRVRDRALNAEGWRTVRITWRQLQLEPEKLALDLRKILRAAPPARARAADP
jgi:very-short-patch-repair endonuclease